MEWFENACFILAAFLFGLAAGLTLALRVIAAERSQACP